MEVDLAGEKTLEISLKGVFLHIPPKRWKKKFPSEILKYLEGNFFFTLFLV
jgi:hypothetical protein